MNLKDKIPCNRCGVCCSTGTCIHGTEDSYGICVYLIMNNLMINGHGNTSCKLLLEHKIKNPKDIGIGVGCILRELDINVYNYYYLQMIERFKFKNGKLKIGE